MDNFNESLNNEKKEEKKELKQIVVKASDEDREFVNELMNTRKIPLQTALGILNKSNKAYLNNIDPNNIGNDPENQVYLLIYYTPEDDGFDQYWQLEIGRLNIYNFIKRNIDEIDIFRSFLIKDNVSIIDCMKDVNVYKFMDRFSRIYEDDFDINEYVDGEGIENPDIVTE